MDCQKLKPLKILKVPKKKGTLTFTPFLLGIVLRLFNQIDLEGHQLYLQNVDFLGMVFGFLNHLD